MSADGMTSHALLDALADQALQLTIEPAPGTPRMLDPTVVAASVDAEGTALATLISCLVALAAQQERGKVIVQGVTGARLQVPGTASSEEVRTSIVTAHALGVVHLHLSGSGR